MTSRATDVLVIGSGIAGLSFALHLAGRARITVVTKKQRADSNTNYAQGGIAAVLGADDAPDLHIRDTLASGAGLCHPDAVELLVREGPARVRELVEWGARFSREGDRLALGREGGHSRRRVVHAADYTGREIERTLLDALARHPDVLLLEDHLALDLLLGTDPASGRRRCAGARVLDRTTGEVVDYRARATLLASGGLGQVYRHTTNPEIATGDGVAMAYRAGADVANLEFVQFHPTALYPAEGRAFLISEAVRGEGAVLRRIDGEPLRDDAGQPLSLRTRDVVARAIYAALAETGDPYVVLDASHLAPAEFEARFPVISAECRARGIDVPREPIPVVPAAHYACGGVVTDADGRTTLPGLYAAGEVACTGVHGANRLASNSLLEALVYSHRAAAAVAAELDVEAGDVEPPPPGPPRAHDLPRIEALRRELQALMWADAGIARSDARLARAEARLRRIRDEVAAELSREAPWAELVELRNLAEVALLIVRCARARKESRGLHYNVDHPLRDDARFGHDTVIRGE
ncbi:MAG: L-aspartate oxidase [Gemmatimonadetes bacterium]|nr:L-aspartate oxidase [Gemmatimonadota bacterium]